MDQLTRAFDVVLDFLLRFGAFCMAFLLQADAFVRARMTELGWTPGVQTTVEVVLTTAAVLLLLRVLAPLLRILLILLLLILALQFLLPARYRAGVRHVEAPCTSVA